MLEIPSVLGEQGIHLSRQQREAAEAASGQILLLAVPGAGKTTVVTARTANLLLNHGVPPERIITLTFNRESAQDMIRRWAALFGGLCDAKPAISTIHSFCYGLLQEYARDRGTRVPSLLEGDGTGAKARLLGTIYREETGSFLTEDQLSTMTNLMGYCVNMHLSPQEIQQAGEGLPGFWPVYQKYTGYKREQGLMDFDDMLLFAHTALARHDALRHRVRERYDHIQVDEAQDTSKLQHEILELVVRDNLLMVGDEDQSIYGFRGAYPQGLMEFFKTYPDGRLMKLEQNYRSTGAIVEGASRVISGNRQRYPKAMATHRPRGQEIELITHLPLEEEYPWIAEQLAALPQGESCAVLYRAATSGLGLAHLLRRRGIAFTSRGSSLGYMGDFINRDILSIMALAQNPGSKQAFHRCYFRLGCSIPRDIAARVQEQARGDILNWIIEETDYAGKNTGRLSWTRRVLHKMAGQTPDRQIRTILEDLEYLTTLEKRGQGGCQLSSSLQKLVILRQFAREAASLEELTLLVERAEQQLYAPEPAPIVLSTVHSAKGREFDRVILADALDGVFPISDAIEFGALDRRDLLEEENRLFYTAMTRAKDRLWILAPATALGRRLQPSRLLQPLEEAAAVTVEGVTVQPGSCISHRYFGMGEILAVDRTRGRVEVAFRIGGTKSFTLDSFGDPKLIRFV